MINFIARRYLCRLDVILLKYTPHNLINIIIAV